MKERPIIFSGESVLAILEGRKTQTRRVIKNWPPEINLPNRVYGDWPIGHNLIAEPGIYTSLSNPLGALSVLVDGQELGVKPGEFEWVCPYGKPGDRLWVRENYMVQVAPCKTYPKGEVKYAADYPDQDCVFQFEGAALL